MGSAYPTPNGTPASGGAQDPAGDAPGAGAWKDAFRVGDDLIDGQHQTFFRMVAEAQESMDRGSVEGVGRHLNFLAAYAVMHFRDEERLMALSHYPGLVEHRRIHQAFVAQVAGLLKTYETDPDAVTAQQILPMIQDWLVFHILGMDKQLQPWIGRMGKP
ncbi:hypothetical protein GETHPA_16300 [Geothrix rubra]|uniref:Hemerythrin-like domain-containing protein n=1 Tax=Geothrix rubra TaxID=2927977 RepID=A0ABQ5Q675_9BACT|nr:hemerythrin family protein [Geothrix rubra]GLH70097.1 hypothetical protein GETHPA_16300 [Geothrix rubra]